MLGMPSLRSCSVGPPPSAIHGRGRLTRHPCRVAHCAEPALGLTRGRTPQQRPRRPTGRPGCWVRSSVMYLWLSGRLREQARKEDVVVHGFCARHRSNVGAGLLAKAECQPTKMLNDKPHSRASPLPQGLGTSANTRSAARPPSLAGHSIAVDRRTPTLLTTHQAER